MSHISELGVDEADLLDDDDPLTNRAEDDDDDGFLMKISGFDEERLAHASKLAAFGSRKGSDSLIQAVSPLHKALSVHASVRELVLSSPHQPPSCTNSSSASHTSHENDNRHQPRDTNDNIESSSHTSQLSSGREASTAQQPNNPEIISPIITVRKPSSVGSAVISPINLPVPAEDQHSTQPAENNSAPCPEINDGVSVTRNNNDSIIDNASNANNNFESADNNSSINPSINEENNILPTTKTNQSSYNDHVNVNVNNNDNTESDIALDTSIETKIEHLLSAHPHHNTLPLHHHRLPAHVHEPSSPNTAVSPLASTVLPPPATVFSPTKVEPTETIIANDDTHVLSAVHNNVIIDSNHPSQEQDKIHPIDNITVASSSLPFASPPKTLMVDTNSNLMFESLRNVQPEYRAYFLLWSRLQARQESVVTAVDALPILANQMESHYQLLRQHREEIFRFAVEVSPPTNVGQSLLNPEGSDLSRTPSVPWKAFAHEIFLSASDKKRWLHLLRNQESSLKTLMNSIHDESEAIYYQIELLSKRFAATIKQHGYDATNVTISPMHTRTQSKANLLNNIQPPIMPTNGINMSDIIDLLHNPKEVLKRIYEQHQGRKYKVTRSRSGSPKKSHSPSSAIRHRGDPHDTNNIGNTNSHTNNKTLQKYRSMKQRSEASGIIALRRSFGEWIRLRAAYEESRRVKKTSLSLLEKHLHGKLTRMQNILSFVNKDLEYDEINTEDNPDEIITGEKPDNIEDEDSDLSGVEDKLMRKLQKQKAAASPFPTLAQRRRMISMKDPQPKVHIRKIGKFASDRLKRPKSANAVAAKARGAAELSPMQRAEAILLDGEHLLRHRHTKDPILSPLRLAELSKKREFEPFIATENQQENASSPFRAKPFAMPPPYEEKTVLIHFPYYESPGNEKIRENKQKLHTVVLKPSKEELQKRHSLYKGIDLDAKDTNSFKMLTRDTALAGENSPKKYNSKPGDMEEMFHGGLLVIDGKKPRFEAKKDEKLSVSEIKAVLRKGLSAKVLKDVMDENMKPSTPSSADLSALPSNTAQYKLPLSAHEQTHHNHDDKPVHKSDASGAVEASLVSVSHTEDQQNRIQRSMDELVMLEAEWAAEHGEIPQLSSKLLNDGLERGEKDNGMFLKSSSTNVLQLLAKSNVQPTPKAIALRPETIALYDFSSNKLKTVAKLTEAVNDIKAYNQAHFGSPEQRLKLQKKRFLTDKLPRPHSAHASTPNRQKGNKSPQKKISEPSDNGDANRWGGTFQTSQLAESSDGADDYDPDEVDSVLKAHQKLRKQTRSGINQREKSMSKSDEDGEHKTLSHTTSRPSLPSAAAHYHHESHDSVLSAFGVAQGSHDQGEVKMGRQLENSLEGSIEPQTQGNESQPYFPPPINTSLDIADEAHSRNTAMGSNSSGQRSGRSPPSLVGRNINKPSTRNGNETKASNRGKLKIIKDPILRQKLESSNTYKVRARMQAELHHDKNKHKSNSNKQGISNQYGANPNRAYGGIADESDDTCDLEDIIMGRAPGASKAVTPVPVEESNPVNYSTAQEEGENVVGEIPRVESTALLSYFALSSGAAANLSPEIHKPTAVRANGNKQEVETCRRNKAAGSDYETIDKGDDMEVQAKPKRYLLESFQPFHLNTFRRQLFFLLDDAFSDDNNQPLDEHQKQILHVKQMTWSASVHDIAKYLSSFMDPHDPKEPLKEELQNLLVEDEEEAWYQMYFDVRSLLQEFVVKRTRKFIQSSPLMQLECDLELTELYLLQSIARDLSFHHQRKREPETAQYASHAFQPSHTGQMFIPDYQVIPSGNEDATGGVVFTPVSHPIFPPSGPLQLPIDLVAGSVINPISNMQRQQLQQQKKRKTGARSVSPTTSQSSQLAQFVSPHNQFKDFEGMLDRQYHRHIRALDRLLDGYRVSVAPFRTGGSLGHEQRDRALLVTAGPEALLQHQLHHNQQLHLQQNKYYSKGEQTPVSPSETKTQLTKTSANRNGEEGEVTRSNIPLTNIPSAFDLLPSKESKNNNPFDEDDIIASWNQIPSTKVNTQKKKIIVETQKDENNNSNDINSDQSVRDKNKEEPGENKGENVDYGRENVHSRRIQDHSSSPTNERPLNLAKAFHLDQQVDYHAHNVQKLRRQVMHALLSGIEIRCVAALAPLLSLVVLELHHLAEDDNHENGFEHWLKDVVLNPFSCQRSNDIVQGDDDHVIKGNFVHVIESLLNNTVKENQQEHPEEDEGASFLTGCDWHEFVFHKAQKQVHTVEKWSATLTAAIEHNLEVARKAGQSLYE